MIWVVFRPGQTYHIGHTPPNVVRSFLFQSFKYFRRSCSNLQVSPKRHSPGENSGLLARLAQSPTSSLEAPKLRLVFWPRDFSFFLPLSPPLGWSIWAAPSAASSSVTRVLLFALLLAGCKRNLISVSRLSMGKHAKCRLFLDRSNAFLSFTLCGALGLICRIQSSPF